MNKRPSPQAVRAFRKRVYDHYRKNRREFSWRKTKDPYHVLVSEIMLQQTQTDRVEGKFREFTALFPDIEALASARSGDVLRAWQGMGYNRRAVYLHIAAQEVMKRYGGRLPRTVEELEELPGVGPATARSISAYAYNEPVVYIETNIRAVYIHEFFGGRKGVTDEELMPLVERTLDRANPGKWYNALMDYGVMLKAKHGNPSRRSAHYKKQSPFLNSDRRIRGEIVRRLARSGALPEHILCGETPFSPERIRRCLETLLKDGLVRKKGNKFHLG